jgi:hypothetical protein
MSADNIYLSLTMRNTTDVPQLEQYSANLDASVLKNPSLFELSVDRSQLNTGTLPVFRYIENKDPSKDYGPPLGPPNYNPLYDFKSILVVACEYNGNVVHRNLVFSAPNNLTSGVMSNGCRYGDIYSFQRFVQIYNRAMAECIAELKASFGLNALCPDPILSFSGDTDKFQLFLADYQTYFVETLPSPVVVKNDIVLGLNLLKGFDFIYTNETHAEYSYRCIPQTGMDVTLSQDYSTLSIFSPAVNVYLRTTLNVQHQYERDDFTQKLASTSILRDYNLFLNDETQSLSNSYVFNLVVQREFISIVQTNPLQSISVAVYWRDVYGYEYPVYMAPYTASNVKLYFRKRDQYRYTTNL